MTSSQFTPCLCPIKKSVWSVIRQQGEDMIKRDPILEPIINQSILIHESFGEALATRLARKLRGENIQNFEEKILRTLFLDCLQFSRGNDNEDIEKLAMIDMIAVEERDPACRQLATVFLYYKGYMSLQCYRFSHSLWNRGRIDIALMLQSKAAEVFGIDIHPGAKIGCGLMMDHGTGVVIGETAVIGKNCTFLHGVTLGGTGRSNLFDRHPKLGDNVFLGCQCTILGNISIGSNVTVGAGSLVLKPLPDGVVAVGSPATIKTIDPRFQNTIEKVPEPLPRGGGGESENDDDDTAKDNCVILKLWSSTWMPKVFSEVDGWLDNWHNNSNTTMSWEDRVISGYVDDYCI